MTSAVFVDLPNFYSHLLRSQVAGTGGEAERLLRDYFLCWLDFDRLAEWLTGECVAVWAFYSGRRFGPSPNRIEGKYLNTYINRINSLTGVTARDVNIPGEQREAASYHCEKCGHEGVAQWDTEKGIDASLIVHLFDTMDAWDRAYLLSGDADFVPAVASLRRRGKIVIGASFPQVSSALVRECYDYIDLCSTFLRDDVAAYEIFKKDGLAKRWLCCEPQFELNIGEIETSIEWHGLRATHRNGTHLHSMSEIARRGPYCFIYLMAKDRRELERRDRLVSQFAATFPDYVVDEHSKATRCRYQLIVSPLAWNGVERRLGAFTSSLTAAREYEGSEAERGYKMQFRFIESKKGYEPVRD